VGLVAALAPFSGCANLKNSSLEDILGTTGSADPLDEPTVVAGLKEALRVGSERTVAETSRLDGFWENPLIRIVLPAELDPVVEVLQDVGLEAEVEAFEITMNRAAEEAASRATPIFWDAITAMTVADGFAILEGGDSAATDYFRERTSASLRAQFQPVVAATMEEVGLYRHYTRLLDVYTALPLYEKPDLDLERYITEKALAGLFTVLAQEEQRIRQDPLARTTELLRRVFG
jgi:hypothetical protein